MPSLKQRFLIVTWLWVLVWVMAAESIFAVEPVPPDIQGKEDPAAPQGVADPAPAAAPKKAAAQPVEIADEPRTIDPATLIDPVLVKKVTVVFADSQITDLIDWLRTDQKLTVLADESDLREAALLVGEAYSDRLDDEPLYLLLDRLKTFDLGWSYEDGVLRIASQATMDGQLTTKSYLVGDLLDAGYRSDALVQVFMDAIKPDGWRTVGGPASVLALGDVLFVRQTALGHREVAGLLAALRKPARRTFTCDPPQHAKLRAKFAQNVTLKVRDVPLVECLRRLGGQAGVQPRIDRPALSDEKIRERSLVALDVANQPLKVALQVLLHNLKLTWVFRDGVGLITTEIKASEHLLVAVYDVRDLCRDDEESEALLAALIEEISPDTWDEVGGPGAALFARPGLLVARATENVHDEVLGMLDMYRAALRMSKPRKRQAIDLQDVVTHYYRLPAPIAADLETALPQLLRPETWKSARHPDANGTILRLASTAELIDKTTTTVPNAVLVIRQTREIHLEISPLLQDIQHGDMPEESPRQGRGGPGGIGGVGGAAFDQPPLQGNFGGGYFSDGL